MTDAEPTPSLTRATLWLMTITAGVVVGNNYYNQPLLGLAGHVLRSRRMHARAGRYNFHQIARCTPYVQGKLRYIDEIVDSPSEDPTRTPVGRFPRCLVGLSFISAGTAISGW